jgi:hypothetical protein
MEALNPPPVDIDFDYRESKLENVFIPQPASGRGS